MTHAVISTCPVCSHELAVTRLHCTSCGTVIEGDFSVGRFARLDRDQMGLLEGFLRTRGNLRELERELRLSYPTVRARIDSLLRALDLHATDADVETAATAGISGIADEPADDASIAAARRTILERLANHEISADDAAAAIRALGGAYAWHVTNDQ
jgi:hypothetical protein